MESKPKYIIKLCSKHGTTKFVLEGKRKQRYRCLECRSEACTIQRRRKKEKLVALFDSKCVVCGYNKCIAALEFHHLDENKKDFGLSARGYFSFERLKKEANKCVLLCARCHREAHAGILSVITLYKLKGYAEPAVSAEKQKDKTVLKVYKRRKKVKNLLIAHFGGSCQLCQYNACSKALEFHHIDEATKEFGLSAQGMTLAYDRLLAESEKCVMVCINCHREIHAGIHTKEKLVELRKTVVPAA